MGRFDDRENNMNKGWFVYKPMDKLFIGFVFIIGLATICYYVAVGASHILGWLLT